PSCSDEPAIIARAASPYDCQAKVAETPMQNTIRKRASLRETRLPNDSRAVLEDDRVIASIPGLPAPRRAGNSDCFMLNVASIGVPPCLLRPAAHCFSSNSNSASSASSVGRCGGDSTSYWSVASSASSKAPRFSPTLQQFAPWLCPQTVSAQ